MSDNQSIYDMQKQWQDKAEYWRNIFAGMAMQGMMSADDAQSTDEWFYQVAQSAVKQADFLLSALAATEEGK